MNVATTLTVLLLAGTVASIVGLLCWLRWRLALDLRKVEAQEREWEAYWGRVHLDLAQRTRRWEEAKGPQGGER